MEEDISSHNHKRPNRNSKSSKRDEISLLDIDTILKPLSNPTRQQMLLLLSTGPITYTQILQTLNMESGSFYWHIGKMEELVTQNDLKEYQLSDLGRKAYDLLVYDGTNLDDSTPFRPSWYLGIYNLTRRLYQIPSWIILQQVIIILIVTGYFFQSNNILQLGTLPLISSNETSLLFVVLSILGSISVIGSSIIGMQVLYIQPDRPYFTKSLLPLMIRIFLSSSILLGAGLIFALLFQFSLDWVVLNPIFQLILSLCILFMTIIFSTAIVDEFLDLGLKDSLLIVLPPYYVIVLVSFFLAP